VYPEACNGPWLPKKAVKDGEGVNQQITYSDLPTLIRSDLPKRGANLCVIGTDPKSRRQVGHVWDGFANAIIVGL